MGIAIFTVLTSLFYSNAFAQNYDCRAVISKKNLKMMTGKEAQISENIFKQNKSVCNFQIQGVGNGFLSIDPTSMDDIKNLLGNVKGKGKKIFRNKKHNVNVHSEQRNRFILLRYIRDRRLVAISVTGKNPKKLALKILNQSFDDLDSAPVVESKESSKKLSCSDLINEKDVFAIYQKEITNSAISEFPVSDVKDAPMAQACGYWFGEYTLYVNVWTAPAQIVKKHLSQQVGTLSESKYGNNEALVGKEVEIGNRKVREVYIKSDKSIMHRYYLEVKPDLLVWTHVSVLDKNYKKEPLINVTKKIIDQLAEK